MKKFFLLLILLAMFSIGSVWSNDFGLILDQTAGVGGSRNNSDFDYSGVLMPQFSTFLGDDGDFFISAGLKLDYRDGWTFVPELLRTEFSWSIHNGFFRAGRIQYSDPLGFVVSGLFDGAQLVFDTQIGTFNMGVWYTGLLYKKRAEITMNDKEFLSFNTDVDYGDLWNTYFAPRRIFSAIGWEHPGLMEFVRVQVSLLGQFDQSGEDIHTQYFIGRVNLPFNAFVFNFGACFGWLQISGESNFALAGELGVAFPVPYSPYEDELSIMGRFSSGTWWENNSFTAFLPITTKYLGYVLKPRFSGISAISLDYLARINQTMSVGFSSNYFIRNDLVTLQQFGNEGYFLGNEFFARFLWSPASDLQLNFGAGIFLPIGDAAPTSDPVWRCELSIVFSLF